jgi:hypothetical protein
MYVTSRASITQSVFALNNDAAPARAVVTLISELGIGVRAPDPKEVAVLAEVHRPEGVILSALVGAPYEETPAAGSWAREVNEEKDRAASDRERRERLEEGERRALEERLAPDGGARRVAGSIGRHGSAACFSPWQGRAAPRPGKRSTRSCWAARSRCSS